MRKLGKFWRTKLIFSLLFIVFIFSSFSRLSFKSIEGKFSQNKKPYSLDHSCSVKETAKQVQFLIHERVRQGWLGMTSLLGCHSLLSLEKFLANKWNPAQQNITIVNIGANKGYNLADWMATWVAPLHRGPKDWGKHIHQIHKKDFNRLALCGVCRCCKKKIKVGKSKYYTWQKAVKEGKKKASKSLRMVAVEPSRMNVELLLEFQKWAKRARVEVIRGAVSNFSGSAKFPVTKLGDAKGVLGSGEGRQDEVPVFTLDGLMEEREINHIHFLKIDTEGHDPLVLKGGSRAFSTHSISLVEFEYHRKGPWQETPLKVVVEEMDSWGYDCYLEIPLGEDSDSLVKLTKCWHSTFEFKQWSNILCGSRRDPEIASFLFRNARFLAEPL